MLKKRPVQVTDAWDAEDDDAPPRHRTARYVVPVAVAGVAAVTIGLVPAFAGAGAPDLPEISAEQLIAKVAESDVQQLSGTVKVNTDLGLPSLPGSGAGGANVFSGGPNGEGGKDGAAAADPQAKLMELATGSHTLRVAADDPDRHRLSVIDDAAEYSLIHNGGEVWAYDSAANAAYHASAPADGSAKSREREALPKDVTPQEFARQALKAVDSTTSVKVDGTARVAGRDAYQLVIRPKQTESTVGSVRIAVDAQNGVPLKFTLSPESGGKAIVDAGFTSVDFAKPDESTFAFTPPKGAEVTEQKEFDRKGGRGWQPEPDLDLPLGPSAGSGGLGGLNVIGEGWTSVAELKAPDRTNSPSAGSGDDKMPQEARGFMDSLGDKVSGKFGKGTVFSTRLVNALMTEDGGLYVGAVDKDALVKAANEAQ
ncbi:LolA family protein [Streptomyces sp. 8N706]|uniref:LolA family protein n=1 Tax=Streptomyces sp. 8N706 TaxID=3457416 RepID=UPI003FD038BD